MDTAEIRRRFVAHFERRAWGAHPRAVGVAAPRRPEPAVRQRRHGAVQALLPRPGDAALPARGQRPEVRAHPRHRGRRQDHPARHVLRDVRQLLLRRLLQGGRHRAGLGPGHQAARRRRLRARGEPALPVDPRRRRRGAASSGRRSPGCPTSASSGSARRRTTGRWASPGPGGPCSEILYDRGSEHGPDFEPDAAARTCRPSSRTATWRSGTWSSCRTSCSAVAAKDDFDIVGLAAEEEHRHRHGPGAGRVPAPGRRQHVRDRRDVPGHRARRGAHRPPLRRRPRRRRPVPGRRRPRPQLADADRRRRHAGQRGPRLRAAPAAAPRGPLDAAARLRGPGAARAAAGQPGQDGRDLRRAAPRLGADLDGGLRRGGGVPADAARRHHDLRHRGRRGEAGRRHRAVRRPGLRAARHLRLPDRPDPGDGLRAGAPASTRSASAA